MTTYDTDRAASEVIGAVLIFSFLVISFAVYQGIIVPEQNRDVELEHNQQVQRSMQELRNAVRQTAETGTEAAFSIDLGTDYPQRTLAINPGVSAGNLRTAPLGSLVVENVTASDPEVRDYVGETTTTLGPFGTKAVVYRPLYAHYSEAPVTVYENSLAANQFPSGVNLSLTDQSLVDGRTISLVALNGSLSEATQDTVTVDTEAISPTRRTITVTNETGPITLLVPTRLTAADWTELLADELDGPGTTDAYVTSVRQAGPSTVAIELRPNVSYELRLAMVGVGSRTTSTTAKYVTTVEGDRTSVPEGGTQKLVAETRDRFNNPVSNVTVSAAVVDGPGNIAGSTSAVTDADGQVTFVYEAPGNVFDDQSVDVNVTLAGGTDPNRTATFDLTVLDTDSGGAGGTINPGGNGTVVLEDSTIDSAGCGDGGAGTNCHVTLTLNNTGSETVIIERVRYNFYGIDKISPSPRDVPDYLDFDGVDLVLRGPYAATSESLAPGTTDLDLRFYTNSAHTLPYEVQEGDFFIVSVILDDGRSATYFVAPP